ncbi:NADH:flavin oxidoreductase/NADH oxidase [Sphingomonas sp.]|uniref:NADH:flavin oxidoreductase/NADH oxidase n=1 Tax=Sphingomonas sp. TaxID=28214 RepID=UPI000CCA6EC1|nr:NADH:flavin oxidoreductase/NADH oxidase [Sphingomonas sp.]MDK2768949.1 NADH:flavin oxidoreductase/NADH oxidase [Sphingomonas sp.]PKP92401.1 MAG: oxidoreductase [Alphaproteobacteria bacterium HGW-Alphaproteobacteria-16]PZU59883.1 MAG: oxidoreductase [Sphingobium sp.]
MTASLFTPFTLRGVSMRNRIGVSPMCQYSATDGLANAWHLTHLASRAVGGAGLVVTEAAAVVPEGRISPADLGLWSDRHVEALRPVAAAIAAAGAIPGIQLAHAGRKGSTQVPWLGREAVPLEAGGWRAGSATAAPFSARSAPTYALDTPAIAAIVDGFGAAARRAVAAGFRWVECHFAHGYLVHSFLSPLVNDRTDDYGGSFEGRARLALEIVRAVRAAMPDDVPVAVRLSCVDWTPGGWTLDESVRLSRLLGEAGADLIDCSSGSAIAGDAPPNGPAVQRDFARIIRAGTDMPTAAVGGIVAAQEAEAIVAEGGADIVLLARAMLRDPYWALHAARALGETPSWPPQYARAIGTA